MKRFDSSQKSFFAATFTARGLSRVAMTTAFLLTPFVSHAIVDMKNANYADSWLDLTLPSSGYALKVQRFYNSRSVFSGIFGFGWCSDFETTLERTPEGRVKVTECGAGQEVIYSPAKYDGKNLNSVIDQIIAYYKKTTPGASSQSVETLREQLRDFADLRSRWSRQAGLAIPEVKKGSVFTADGLEVEQIVFDGGVYTRNMADGTMQKFDSQGRLTSMSDKNSNYLKFIYGETFLKEVVDNSGKKLSFVFYPNKRVKEILATGGIKIEYKFKGEDLAEVKNMWKNKYSYEYDENHNLTKISFPDNTTKLISYNQKNDWVTSFTDRAVDGVACVEKYNYEVDKNLPKDHFWSTATKTCGKEVTNEARFEFWHKTRASGSRFLARVLTKSNSDTLDVTYHPEFGKPMTVKRNGTTTSFEYYTNGLVREKATDTFKMTFEYKNTFNKVSKVSTEFLDQKGKVLKRRDTDFAYDSRANLVAANNTDGQVVKLTYDDRGRIATIIDQAKKEVRIKYEERVGKPATITRPSVGSIKIDYKPNGEIDKVTSADGPTVAVQIASTFNNLLDVIAPATSELSL